MDTHQQQHTGQGQSEAGDESTSGGEALRVVECPDCQTRFALDPVVLVPDPTKSEDEADPDLHCSHCDSIFLLSENPFFNSTQEYISARDHSPLRSPSSEDSEEIEEATEERETEEQEAEIEDPVTEDVVDVEEPASFGQSEDEALAELSRRFGPEEPVAEAPSARPTGEVDVESLFDDSEETPSVSEEEAKIVAPSEPVPLQENLFSLFQTKTRIPQPPAQEPIQKEDGSPLFSAEKEVLQETLEDIAEEVPPEEDAPEEHTAEENATELEASPQLRDVEEQDEAIEHVSEQVSEPATEEEYSATDAEDESEEPLEEEEPEKEEESEDLEEEQEELLAASEEELAPEELEEEEEPEETFSTAPEGEQDESPHSEPLEMTGRPTGELEGLTKAKSAAEMIERLEAENFEEEYVQEQAQRTSKIIDINVQDAPLEETIETSEIIYAEQKSKPGIMGPTTSTFFLASPIIGFVLLLFAFGNYIHEEGASQEFIRSVASSQLPVAPPATLSLRDVSFKRSPLLSGGEIFSVEATLSNNDKTEFSQVQVEAALFDENGVRVATRSIPAGRPVNAKGGLPSEKEVLNFQDQYSKRDNTLEAGKEKSVSVYFTADEARRAKFYTMRLHSVLR